MAQDNIIGIAMDLDISDLKAGLQETKKAIDQANAKFKSATAGMDDWNNSTDGVRENLDFLNVKLLNQKKNIAGYEAQIQQLTQEYGANSVQVEKLTIKLANEQKALAKTEKDIRQQTVQLNLLEGAYVDTVTDVGQLENGLKKLNTIIGKQKTTVAQYEQQLARAREEHGETSNEVKELTNRLNRAKTNLDKTQASAKKYAQQLDKVQSETASAETETGKLNVKLKETETATTKLKGGFTVLKGAIANLVSTGITSLISGLKNAVTESRDFRREMAYLSETTKATNSNFDQIKDKLKEISAITGDQEATIEGLNNLMSAGFQGDMLDDITDQLVGASIKWKDTLKFEGLSDSLQETLATGSGTGQFIELLERCGIVADDFNNTLKRLNSTEARQEYVLSTLASLGLNEVKQGYEEANKSLIEANKASFDYAEAQAKLGEKIEPVLTEIQLGFANILNTVSDSDGETTQLQSTIRSIFQSIASAVQWMTKHAGIVKASVVAIGGAFLTWKAVNIISDVTKAIKELDLSLIKNSLQWAKNTASKLTNKTATLSNVIVTKAQTVATMAQTVATKGATMAQKLLNVALKSNPIGIVITAIALLVGAFVTLWNKSEAFRNFWLGMWESIKNAVNSVVGWLKKAFTTIVSAFVIVTNKIRDTIKNLPNEFFAIGVNMIQGLINGIKSLNDKVKDAITDTVMKPVDWVKDKLGIASPSKLMRDEVGAMMGEGIGVGILASTKNVISDVNQFIGKVTAGLQAINDVSISPSATASGGSGNITNITNYSQVINAPKQPSRIELYRQTKNLLTYNKS